ncbi:MAG: hypothetical protein O3B95_06885 [Chloroflexi bacterium]|nr:hypothetical protein [Chloroflexota bacterium]
MTSSVVSRFVIVVLALAAIIVGACSKGTETTPSPWINPPDDPTPTPVITTENGVTRVTVHLSSFEGAGQVGTATLSSSGDTTLIEIAVSPRASDAQPIHVHAGSCDDVGPVIHALRNVVNGKSSTIIDRPLGEILGGDVLINVHASFADASNYTACGPLPPQLASETGG